MIKGYLPGVFDLFHIGHLNVIRRAKERCDYLIVGVTSDQRCFERKGITPFIPEIERLEIVKSVRHVDQAELLDEGDKLDAWERHNFHVIFAGSDWQETKEWRDLAQNLEKLSARVQFLPYTQTTSSSKVRERLAGKVDERKLKINNESGA